MRPFLLLFLSACSGVQGIPVAPRAPVFNPVTDAPIVVGQPGYIGSPERAPRGESKRVLPPTREPGIWASDKPKMGPTEFTIPLLGAPLYIPKDPTGYEVETIHGCAVSLRYAAGLAALAEATAWTDDERACAAARLYLHCAQGLNREAAQRKADGSEYDTDATAALKRILDAARAMERTRCKKPLGPAKDRLLETVKGQWTEDHETPP